MQLLALLHRWAGAVTGLLLAVIGLTGAVLVWEESWIGLPGADDPLRTDAAAIGDAVGAAMAASPSLSRITFADERFGLHQAIYADGSGAYLTQAGKVVDRWDSIWGRPELWLFDLHHHLFLGETGKYLTGALGLLLLVFAATGLILWWRTRRTFKFRFWPARMTRSAVVRQHRDIGAVTSPILVLSALTGALMSFPALSQVLTTPWAGPHSVVAPPAAGSSGAATDWRRLMRNAQAPFPQALPRRLTLPARPGEPVILRLKQGFEWTPNGRTYVYLDPATEQVLAIVDPVVRDRAAMISEKYYPIHAGKVGGALWRIALTFAGLVLLLLGTFATWSFWFAGKPAPLPRRVGLAAPAE